MSGGAGSAAAGATPAGYDPAFSTPAFRPNQTDAIKFNLQNKSTPRDANGLLETTHWVDQAVNLALGIEQGKFAPQTTLGNKLRKIKRAGGPTLESEATDAIRQALEALIDRKDIGVLSLRFDTSIRGRIVVQVSYMNLRLVADQSQTTDFSKIKFVF